MLANAEEAAESAVAIDPTVLALLTIFGSVTVTVLVGLIGAWLQSKREHARWLRERRYEAAVKAYALTKGFDLNWSKTMKIAESEGASEDNPRLLAMLAQADEPAHHGGGNARAARDARSPRCREQLPRYAERIRVARQRGVQEGRSGLPEERASYPGHQGLTRKPHPSAEFELPFAANPMRAVPEYGSNGTA